jgi:phytoene dehydrogenase-like protein
MSDEFYDAPMTNVAVLFARRDSIYKDLGCDVYDADRNALTFPGGKPVVAHPPCRAWGRLRHFARPREGERELALWAVTQVRRWGGVLEHPVASLLWLEAKLPKPGERDCSDGWTMSVSQWWFGHRADKPTLLYICGAEPRDLPNVPFKIGAPTHVVQSRKRIDHRPHISKAEREHTPIEFARWLIRVALLAGRVTAI